MRIAMFVKQSLITHEAIDVTIIIKDDLNSAAGIVAYVIAILQNTCSLCCLVLLNGFIHLPHFRND